MPQMMPLMWLLMTILLISILLMLISFIYYMYLPNAYAPKPSKMTKKIEYDHDK